MLNGPTEFGIKSPTPVQFTTDKTRVCRAGDILFCVRGSTTGRMNWADREYVIGRGLASIRHRNGLEYQHFLKGIMDDALPTLLSSATGSTFPNVSKDQLKGLDILVPSLPEQKAIASVLSSLDDKIDLLHRQNKTLEGMAEALWRKMFLEEAEDDWKKGHLSEVVVLASGKSRPDENSEGVCPMYGGNGILGYCNQQNVDGDSIIIGRVGAYCGSLFIENKPIWVTDNALIAKPIKNGVIAFLFYLLKTLDLNSMAEGSSHPLLTQTLLKSIEIDIPPEKEILFFCSIANNWRKKIESNNIQIASNIKIRDTLLPKLMSGEIKIKSEHD